MKKVLLQLEKSKQKFNYTNDSLVIEVLMVLFFIAISIIFPVMANAQKDKDGAENYSPGGATTYILNRYSPLASSAAAGSSSVTVTDVNLLSGATGFANSTNPYTTNALAVGDLVMIIQVQGADITTTDDAAYGTITNYNNVGNYEFKTVQSIVGNTINFCVGLSNEYTVGGRGRAQVVRVPRLTDLTVGANGIISAMPWSGTAGGVCALEVNGNALINGTINTTATGFRGGTAFVGASADLITIMRTTTASNGAFKGESIAGNQTDYASLNGQYGRGAPANGGGGGNAHNAPGGGGSNAGNNGVITPYNGTGIKSTATAAWANAWNLEAAGFATDISRGGGRGGYAWGNANLDALTVAPGNITWGGNQRLNNGGFGGRPLDYMSNTKLFLGGGGGSGEGNEGLAGSGGNGGGIVYLLVSGTVSGTGNITSNGGNGNNSTGGQTDAPGGGGGGGAVIVLSNTSITTITMNVLGGNGGNNTNATNVSLGPGGGGGGGYILTTTTSVTRNINGGTNGTTTSTAVTEFIPNGATQGDAGTRSTAGVFLIINECTANNTSKDKDGTEDYSPGVSTTYILNRYAPMASSAAVAATSVTVTNIALLSGATGFANSTNPYASNPLGPGDLVMIVQMQGADITTTNDAAYGAITAYNNVGNYELKTVLSVVGNTINFCVGLSNNYTVGGRSRAQVVRVPRLTNLTVGVNGIISAMPWNGTEGGVCAIEVNGVSTINGAINTTGTGFRGGIAANNAGAVTTITSFRSTNVNDGALKGEGIAGNQTDYASLNGQYCRGAAANGGGGGNLHNAGGGGGSNAGNNGSLTPWNGTGIKSVSTAAWANAWNLEAAGFATDISRGGGRGGYSYGGANRDALTEGPGDVDWAGDNRQNTGGFGGRPLDYASNTRLFLGGGGGAGDANNGGGGSGGNGGGIVYLLSTGPVSGTGNITSNGANGANTVGGHNDAPGGAGGGGAIIVLSNSTITGITANANGGNGGNQLIVGDENEGPGGGGGGGYILTTTTSITRNLNGGANGTTSSSAVTEFIPNGATRGDAGTTSTAGIFLIINDCYREINGFGTPSCTYTAGTVSIAGTILNSYYPATASAAVGATKISVGSIRSSGSLTPIAPGDLLLVIQMQGSTINSTNTSAYGGNTASFNGYLTTVAGTYEYVYASSGVVGGNTINLANPLKNAYTSAAATGSAGAYTFQVIRVPEYASLTINAGASVTATAWNGSTGGVVVANVRGNLSLGTGTAINVAGQGFRGGGGRLTNTTSAAVRDFATSASSGKGEGIAGTPRFTFNGTATIDNTIEGYPDGSTGTGAPANAGGGNSSTGDGGAGGGSNLGAGGRGGRNWNSPAVDDGGYGGAAFAAAATTRLILGGGGGAGTTNNGSGALGAATSSGSAGGGMVLINTASISGTSTINANGANALNPDGDGAGGGGAGGSVHIFSTNPAGLANITINANGGNGGSNSVGSVDDGTANNGLPEHGPGGGGGGGAIYTNGNIAVASSVNGGLAGKTTTVSLAYFATPGRTGFCNRFTNLALTGTATQVSTIDPANTQASKAIDDNTNSHYFDYSQAVTNNLVNPWWRVDWASTATVQQIVIWNRTDGGGTRLNGAIVEILDAGGTVLWTGTIPVAAVVNTLNTGSITNARAVRVRIPRNEYLQLTEVQVFGFVTQTATTTPTIPVRTYCDIDDDNDGIIDSNEYPSAIDPFADADNDGIPNYIDPISGTVVGWVDVNSDGVNDNYDADRDGKINQLDIDSDNDGITDNIEGQSTASYVVPTVIDTDNDGLNDVYELPAQIGLPTGNGITPYDHDSDGIPDFRDTDSDNDGLFDRNEGHDRNQPTFAGLTQATIDASGDTDGDGLMNTFDVFDITTASAADLFRNVSMGNMGPGGNFAGPSPGGSNIGLVKSIVAAPDRDWRNNGYAILPLNVIAFTVNYQAPNATIKWEVTNELQTNYYEVEYSTDGSNFMPVTKVDAKNTNKADYSTQHNIAGINSSIFYYRVKQVDKNGKIYYTQTAVIRINKIQSLTVYPNPFTSFVNCSFSSTINEKGVVEILSQDGRVIATQSMNVLRGNNNVQINNLERLAQGNYILRLQTATSNSTYKLIKN